MKHYFECYSFVFFSIFSVVGKRFVFDDADDDNGDADNDDDDDDNDDDDDDDDDNDDDDDDCIDCLIVTVTCHYIWLNDLMIS